MFLKSIWSKLQTVRISKRQEGHESQVRKGFWIRCSVPLVLKVRGARSQMAGPEQRLCLSVFGSGQLRFDIGLSLTSSEFEKVS